MIKIYDPYLYAGKFDTASRRRANVKVEGNSVYVSVNNFRKYANYRGFFAYKYDTNIVVKENVTDTNVVTNTNTAIKNTVGQVYRIKKTKLYADSNMNIGYSYKKNTKVTVLENVTKNIDKVKINVTGLVRYVYNSDYVDNNNIVTTVSNKTYRTTQKTKMYANANLTKAYNYLKNTKVTLLSKSNNIAKVRVNKTNLIRYINMKYLK